LTGSAFWPTFAAMSVSCRPWALVPSVSQITRYLVKARALSHLIES
jgi:hypothetical protein